MLIVAHDTITISSSMGSHLLTCQLSGRLRMLNAPHLDVELHVMQVLLCFTGCLLDKATNITLVLHQGFNKYLVLTFHCLSSFRFMTYIWVSDPQSLSRPLEHLRAQLALVWAWLRAFSNPTCTP